MATYFSRMNSRLTFQIRVLVSLKNFLIQAEVNIWKMYNFCIILSIHKNSYTQNNSLAYHIRTELWANKMLYTCITISC